MAKALLDGMELNGGRYTALSKAGGVITEVLRCAEECHIPLNGYMAMGVNGGEALKVADQLYFRGPEMCEMPGYKTGEKQPEHLKALDIVD
eukprot:9378856-Pyramimonas_sp.AAC.1